MEVFGYAALQIIPSMKGATAILDAELNGVAGAAGQKAGRQMGEGINRGVGTGMAGVADHLRTAGSSISSLGDTISGVGGQLTRSITVPAGGAALAVAGITAALGWGRLTSLDSAEAQLRGLGYSAEEVGTITGQVANALEGGMMTLGDGASVAAGALAAGVSEGAELERYISLVDAAAVGMNRSASETGMIFSRVQGSGRLMTQELNMIEESMPGFSNALAEHFGVSMDALREMVTAGEVSSADFMDVMEGFAGGMAAEYAKSWDGMVANTKAYVGMIGEQLLGGVFEQSKTSLGEFIEFLADPEIQAAAAELGVVIGDAFARIVSAVQGAITWFLNLDAGVQRTILAIAGIAIAAGPVLLVIGGITSAIGTFVTSVGSIVGVLARVPAPLNLLGGLFRTMMGVVRGVGAAFARIPGIMGILGNALRAATMAVRGLFTAMLTNPIGLIITAIGLLVAGLAYFFTQTEEGQALWGELMTALQPAGEAFAQLGEQIMGIAAEIMPMLMDAVGQIAAAFIPVIEMIVGQLLPVFAELAVTLITMIVPVFMQLVQAVLPVLMAIIMAVIPIIVQLVQAFVPLVQMILTLVIPIIQQLLAVVVTVFQAIMPVIQGALQIVIGVITTVMGIITGDWSRAWAGIRMILEGVWNVIVGAIRGAVAIVGQVISMALTAIRAVWNAAWTWVGNLFRSIWNSIVSAARGFLSGIRSAIGSALSGIRSAWSAAWSAVGNLFRSIWNSIVSGARGFLSSITSAFSSAMSTIRAIPGNIRSFFASAGSWLVNAGKSIIDGLIRGIRNSVGAVKNAMQNVMSAARNLLPFSPAKEGPFSGRGWTTYSGLAIGEGLADGIGRSKGIVVAAAEELAGAATITVPGPTIEDPQIRNQRATVPVDRPAIRAPHMSSLREDRDTTRRNEREPVKITQHISTQDPEAAAQRSGRLIMAGLR